MSDVVEKALLKDMVRRFALYCKQPSKVTENGYYSDFFVRARSYVAPLALVEEDFIPDAHGLREHNLGVLVSYEVYRRWWGSRRYLVKRVIEGNLDAQTITIISYEQVFRGPFALRRAPRMRRREITLSTGSFAANFDRAWNAWKDRLDRDSADDFWYPTSHSGSIAQCADALDF